MIITSSQIDIAVPREQVFEFMVDPAKFKLWHANVLEVTTTSGMDTGSTGAMEMQILGRRIESSFKIEENDGVGLTRVHSSHGPLKYWTTQVLEQKSPQLTRVNIYIKIDAGSVFMLAEPALESIANSTMESDLKTLKAVLEDKS
ncbi:MAG TPA: SRPBCC family protein [Candidatus Saccharimonadia bacterium]|nr:SRPBCC family protein [Candidatus Saccharimonadia bacterium]